MTELLQDIQLEQQQHEHAHPDRPWAAPDLGIFVVHNKQRKKLGQLPDSIMQNRCARVTIALDSCFSEWVQAVGTVWGWSVLALPQGVCCMQWRVHASSSALPDDLCAGSTNKQRKRLQRNRHGCKHSPGWVLDDALLCLLLLRPWLRYFAAAEVPDCWCVYPWDADDIYTHTATAEASRPQLPCTAHSKQQGIGVDAVAANGCAAGAKHGAADAAHRAGSGAQVGSGAGCGVACNGSHK